MNRSLRARILTTAAIVLAGCTFAFADAGIKVTNVWSRATAPGQTVAGAYFDIASVTPAALVGVESPVARAVELHSMKMEGDVMKMRPVAKIDLPAGKEVKLEPGGLHVMLIDIKQPFKVGEKIPLTLVIESDGKTRKVEVAAEVKEGRAGGHH